MASKLTRQDSRSRLVVLLPARNAEADLPAWFESVERFADAVVALDDGSTDSTASLLETHPLVKVLLRHPRRETYEGWDDGANRNALLEAACGLAPDWILSLDADERIPADDAAALRRFVDTDALEGLAYGMACYRMWGGLRDPRPNWVYRLFAHAPDVDFPRRQLHFDPVPTSIGRDRHVRISVRIQHWGSDDETRRLDRIAKYVEADPQGRFPTGHGGLYSVPERLEPWPAFDVDAPVIIGRRPAKPAGGARASERERPDGDPVVRRIDPVFDDGIAETQVADIVERPDARSSRLVVLLPARNAEADLPAWFESVERFADAVVALDDGSTDSTASLLEAHPLVKVLLRHPRRETYEGWDDGANRNALLEAAAGLAPDWILSLDADERIPADDAAALRRFVDTDALEGLAYGMGCHRMIGDLEHWDRHPLMVYRLFAYEPGQRFPDTRLHFVPIPESIPRSRWTRTTIRIQHVSSLTPERRAARLKKYREADPDHEFQKDYENLIAEPFGVREFEPRPANLEVVVQPVRREPPLKAQGPLEPRTSVDYDIDAPALSAIVISRNDEDRIERVVRAVVEQRCDDPFEVIVVTSGTDRTAQIVAEKFPDVRLIELDRPTLPGGARNAGLRVARGDYISFPGSHVELEPGSLDARIRAHDLGWTMVTGTTLNGTDTPPGWAAYFLDNSMALPGRPSGELSSAPAHCSYDAKALLSVGGFPDDIRVGEDTRVNQALFAAGYRAYRSADIRLAHVNRSRDVAHLVEHFFERGIGMANYIRAVRSDGSDTSVRRFLAGFRTRRIAQIDRNVERWGGGLGEKYRAVRPLVELGVLATWRGAESTLQGSADPSPGS